MGAPAFSVFGPVRSRRLGRSLGVNNVPYKTCTYSCIYCQIGRTTNLTITRSAFYSPEEVASKVSEFIGSVSEGVDYVTFVPDGEPLLDINIGREISDIKNRVPKPVAVLTNASLLFREDAREDLLNADFVSVKVDALKEDTWKIVNRPHPDLKLADILEGVEEFAKVFNGKLTTETMLVNGFNTGPDELNLIADFIKGLNPWRAYVAIPVRPPTEAYVKPPTPEKLVEVYALFADKLGEGRVELLNLPEPPEFCVYGDPENWLLSLVSVHPMRLRHALKALEKTVEDPESFIRRLVETHEISLVNFAGEEFIVRRFGLQIR